MTLADHFREIINRLGYTLLSLTLSCLIFFIYLPQLFKFSPFFFLHTSWDEAFFSLLSISLLLSMVWTVPLILLHVYSWLTPALLPKENYYLKYFVLWLNTLVGLYIVFAPTLFWSLPSFLLTFHSNSFLFTPSLSFLASLVWDFSFSFFFLSLCSPISFYLSISRTTLYFVLVLYSVVFQDIWSMLLMLLPLTISYELSYYLYIWASTWLNKKNT